MSVIARIAASAVGAVIGFYAGFTLLIPLAFVFLTGFAVSKALPQRKSFQGSIAVVGGHLCWMALGMAITARWQDGIADLGLLGAGLLLLLIRPGLMPVIALGCMQLMEIALLGIQLAGLELGTAEHKAITVHLSLYAAGVALLLDGYAKFRKEHTAGGETAGAVGLAPPIITADAAPPVIEAQPAERVAGRR